MNQAELAGSSQMLWQHLAFLKEVFGMLNEFLQDGIHALDRVNLAVAEGKALEQLRDKLIGSHIEAEICLEDTSSMLDQRKHEVNVCVVTSEPLSPEGRFHIHRMLAAVNLRYGMNIRSEFLNRHKQRIGQ